MVLTDRSFFWKNEPSSSLVNDTKAVLTTDPGSDFWQRTHYGFRRDSGHCLLMQVSGDFTMTVDVSFRYQCQFDQCGVIVYQDDATWMKGSIEKENESIGRLGSVVTNLGYSDWATADIPSSVTAISYRLHRRGDDFLLERALPGEDWVQMRIFHLHGIGATLSAGVYACSPNDSSFTAEFSLPEFTDCCWTCEE